MIVRPVSKPPVKGKPHVHKNHLHFFLRPHPSCLAFLFCLRFKRRQILPHRYPDCFANKLSNSISIPLGDEHLNIYLHPSNDRNLNCDSYADSNCYANTNADRYTDSHFDEHTCPTLDANEKIGRR